MNNTFNAIHLRKIDMSKLAYALTIVIDCNYQSCQKGMTVTIPKSHFVRNIKVLAAREIEVRLFLNREQLTRFLRGTHW